MTGPEQIVEYVRHPGGSAPAALGLLHGGRRFRAGRLGTSACDAALARLSWRSLECVLFKGGAVESGDAPTPAVPLLLVVCKGDLLRNGQIRAHTGVYLAGDFARQDNETGQSFNQAIL